MSKRIRGNFNPELIQGGLRQGDNNVVQMFGGGTVTAGHVLIYDANGNAIDGGAPGTVTHSTGALTADQPVFGNGVGDIKVGTKTGNTDQVVTATGSATSGYPLLYDANGNAIARQPRGNTTVAQLADSTTNPTSGNAAAFDGNGNIKDAGVAPAQSAAATAHTFLSAYNSTTGAFTQAQPSDTDLSVSDVTTNNVSTSAHGFAPKAPNDATRYLDGTGAYSVPAGGGGGGGGGVTYGTRASLPGSAAASGTVYICTDSAYSYVSNGSVWQAFIFSNPVVEPVSLSKVNSTPTATLNTTLGGVQFSGTGTGDQVLGYAKAVTPTSTLKVALGFAFQGQAGFILYNSNNGNLYIFRHIFSGGLNLYASRYISNGASISAPATFTASMLWPSWPATTYMLRFDATKWYVDVSPDPTNAGLGAVNVFSENLSTFIGTNFTHVGFGGNLGSFVWGQHLQIVHI